MEGGRTGLSSRSSMDASKRRSRAASAWPPPVPQGAIKEAPERPAAQADLAAGPCQALLSLGEAEPVGAGLDLLQVYDTAWHEETPYGIALPVRLLGTLACTAMCDKDANC